MVTLIRDLAKGTVTLTRRFRDTCGGDGLWTITRTDNWLFGITLGLGSNPRFYDIGLSLEQLRQLGHAVNRVLAEIDSD